MQHAHMEEATSKVDHAPKGKEDAVELEVAGILTNMKRLMRERRCERKRKRAAAAAAVPSADTPFAYPQSGGDDAPTKALQQHTSVQAIWFATTEAVPGTACGAPPVM